MNSIVGIALNGVPFYTGTSEFGADAYYPKSLTTGFVRPIDPDACLGNSDYSDYYHYYSFSPCILTSTPKSASIASQCSDSTSCENDKLSYARQYIGTANQDLTPIGLARDGHKIYGPYNTDG